MKTCTRDCGLPCATGCLPGTRVSNYCQHETLQTQEVIDKNYASWAWSYPFFLLPTSFWPHKLWSPGIAIAFAEWDRPFKTWGMLLMHMTFAPWYLAVVGTFWDVQVEPETLSCVPSFRPHVLFIAYGVLLLVQTEEMKDAWKIPRLIHWYNIGLYDLTGELKVSDMMDVRWL